MPRFPDPALPPVTEKERCPLSEKAAARENRQNARAGPSRRRSDAAAKHAERHGSVIRKMQLQTSE